MLVISLPDILGIVILNTIKLKLFAGHLFSNAVKVMSLISDAHYYVPLRLCRTAGSIYLYKITGI